MCDAVILAGGYSSRAKTNKLALNISGQTVIEKTLEPFIKHCKTIIVVTGHYHKEISEILEGYENIRIVKNEDYAKGMFSSVQTGVKHVTEDFFIIPGDYPLVNEATVKGLMMALDVDGEPESDATNSGCCLDSNHSYDIFIPTYKDRRGHPILIRKCLIEQLLKEDYQSNLKLFRNRYKLYHLPVDNEGILMDIDTYEDYNRLKEVHQEASNVEK